MNNIHPLYKPVFVNLKNKMCSRETAKDFVQT